MKIRKTSLNLVIINHIMQRLTMFIFLLSTAFVGQSQAPEIEWQNTIGGVIMITF